MTSPTYLAPQPWLRFVLTSFDCINGRRCSRCSNRFDIFGRRDRESGWEGYCAECNCKWYSCQFNQQLRSCSRLFAARSLLAFGLNISASKVIRSYLALVTHELRKVILLHHKLRTLQLLWMREVYPVSLSYSRFPVLQWPSATATEEEIIEPLNLRALTLHCGEPYETLNILGLRHPGISQSGLEKVSTSRASHLIHLSNQIGIAHSLLARRATLLDVVCLYLVGADISNCLLYTSPSPRDGLLSRMPSSA